MPNPTESSKDPERKRDYRGVLVVPPQKPRRFPRLWATLRRWRWRVSDAIEGMRRGRGAIVL